MAATVALAGLLAACATSPSPNGTPAKAQAAANPGCTVQSLTHYFRIGSNVLMTMSVENTGRWCFGGLNIGGVATSGSRIVDQPAHGELRLMVREAGVAFGYRPAARYVGPDRFMFTMPSGVGGYETPVEVTVSVKPGPPNFVVTYPP